MVWIVCVCCEKFLRNFEARTFALITPFRPVLHRILCSSETVPNASKQKETHENLSLGSNGVDQGRSLQKILMRLRGTNFFTNFTSLARFALSFV